MSPRGGGASLILSDYYFSDPRLVLIPIEHLRPSGVSPELAAALGDRRAWSAARIALFDAAFALYWTRATALARRTRAWAPPRLRHVAVFDEPLAVHPYAQLLNASAWTLYACDLDPERSHAELAAYLLAHGDRMTRLGEVTTAALHNAAWWADRSDDECAAFCAAAAASPRADGETLREIGDALPWLRRLGHAQLQPSHGLRAGRGRDLPVPRSDAAAAQRLADRCAAVARSAVAKYISAWRGTDLGAIDALVDWLVAAAPRLLICGRGGRVLWDPDAAARVGPVRAELKRASGAAVRDVHADLVVLDRHTRRFLDSLADGSALPAADAGAEQRGYTYMHNQRRTLTYDLDEPGIDRRDGPALPYARAMLGARAVHEWAHLAVAAGWVPLAVSPETYAARVAVLAAHLDAVVANAPESVRRLAADDLAALVTSEASPAGAALARVLLRRMSDYQANLLAARYLSEAERETYVRQNVRALRDEYPPARLWRLVVRALYELQYLRFSAVADRRTFFLRSTWFDADFFDRDVLDDARFDALAAAVAAICDCYAVDETKFLTV